MSIFNVSIQHVVADVRRCAIHPLDVDRALRDVEVEGHEVGLISWRLPVELLRNVAPELFGVLDRLLVELLVLLE